MGVAGVESHISHALLCELLFLACEARLRRMPQCCLLQGIALRLSDFLFVLGPGIEMQVTRSVTTYYDQLRPTTTQATH